MKYTCLFFAFTLMISFTQLRAQTFWVEDFGTGCDQGNAADGYTSTNGTWTVTNTGTNDGHANKWFVSATEANTGEDNCGNGCLDGNFMNRTLHVGSAEVDDIISVPPDNGASYNTGGTCAGFSICVDTDKRVESPVIDCSGEDNISLSFLYMEAGQGTIDNAELWYYDGSAWSMLEDLAKTPTTCDPQGQWTAYTTMLPASANNNANVQIGFHWINNDDAAGSDPSFAVDDITLTTEQTTGMEQSGLSNLNVFAADGKIHLHFTTAQENDYSIEIYNALGQVVFTDELEAVSGTLKEEVFLGGGSSGVYFVRVRSSINEHLRKVFVK